MQETAPAPLSECHGHLMMDGADFFAAKIRHENGVREDLIRDELSALKGCGVGYFRDGGDALSVSLAARDIAAEYGIEYVSPAFAIHKTGHYGGIVGRGYQTEADFRERLLEAAEAHADFIKIMVSGIITFKAYAGLSCPGLAPSEIRLLIQTIHKAGYPVMIHVNGDEQIRACIEAGADSIEHGYFAGEETLRMLADSETVWVPTLAATDAFIGRDGFDETVASDTVKRQMEAVAFAQELGASIACGSDSGAVGVPHGKGTLREEALLREAGIPDSAFYEGSRWIRRTFARRT